MATVPIIHIGLCHKYSKQDLDASTSRSAIAKSIRGTNDLEQVFKAVRRHTQVVRRFPGDTAALAGVFGILEEALKWPAVNMRGADLARVDDEPTKYLD